MKITSYDVKCLLCATELGQLVHGRFRAAGGQRLVHPTRGGRPRCGGCGGSVYLDPAGSAPRRSDPRDFALSAAEHPPMSRPNGPRRLGARRAGVA